jgi:cytosine/adenosine deaminase-related metal-dependent hydrolase
LTMKIRNATLPLRDPKSRWDVNFESNTVTSIQPAAADDDPYPNPSPLLLPPLCHSHIHLDKAYLLNCNSQHHPTGPSKKDTNHPDYSDLAPKDGSFAEALKFTSLAKQRYTPDDLYLRGAQLLATSLRQGVTSCRGFVEIDNVTKQLCLEAAIRLKHDFAGQLELQICAFAQDPIFSTEHGDENRKLLEKALQDHGEHIDVLGSTPYVEQSTKASLQNIEWAIDTALKHNLHLDLHLDYNLDEGQKPLVWDVIRLLNEKKWNNRAKPKKTIVLGHCSRLTLFTEADFSRLSQQIKDSHLPIHFVGLPTSDLFMMGRPNRDIPAEESTPTQRQRGTLQVLDMIKSHRINTCLSINNVGNAFTPWGTGDPLALASMGVGIYQAGTEQDANLLFECVSSRSRKAIGLSDDGADDTIEIEEGSKGALLMVQNKEWAMCPGHLGMKVPARQSLSVKDVVWDPPDIGLREILR